MSQNAWIGLVVGVVVIGGGIWWFTNQPTQAPVDNTTTTDVNTTPATPDTSSATPIDSTPTSVAGTFTMTQVATHNIASSCWSVIDGNVYDLTNWIPQHPGGQQAIKGLCGKDGTTAFHGQHEDAKKQADILATMKIGVLAQ